MTRIGRARMGACLFAALAIGATSCSSDGGGVGATLKDFSITLDETSAAAGEVPFNIQNDGPSAHEFVVFKTDLAPDALPMTEDENGIAIVDEEGAGVEAVDEVEDINPDTSADLKVTLDAGGYVIICNLPDHYQQGMHVGFTAS
jgi:uncharacterized cupredoxin-like copper-binding protein